MDVLRNGKMQTFYRVWHCLLWRMFFLLGIFFLTQLNVSAQQISISGTIIGDDKVPIPGASIIVKGSTIGTVTDVNGKFTLDIPSSAKSLLFSFVGLTQVEIPAGSGTVFNVILSESSTGIDEVVVVGYGVQKKESVVGAVVQIGNETLMRSGNSNVTNALSGKMSGVLTMQQAGEPGANSSEIVIRGVSSWNGSEPLVLVDGVERSFTDLDPNEVESISVLKDASATAVFGAKGANGVIIVTTKRGKIGAPAMSF